MKSFKHYVESITSNKPKIYWSDYAMISQSDEKEIEMLVSAKKLQPYGHIVLSSGEHILWDLDFSSLYVLRKLPIDEISKTVSNQHSPAVKHWYANIQNAGKLNDPVLVFPDEWRGTTIYQLQDGHHRYEAAQQHGLTELPAWVKIADIMQSI